MASDETLSNVAVRGEEGLEGTTEASSTQSEQLPSSHSEQTLHGPVGSQAAATSSNSRVDITSVPDVQTTETTHTSTLTLQNLERHNKDVDRLLKEDSEYRQEIVRQHDLNTLKESFKSLGVDIDDDIIDSMVPASAGATVLERITSEGNDRTAQGEAHSKKESANEESNDNVRISELEEMLAAFKD